MQYRLRVEILPPNTTTMQWLEYTYTDLPTVCNTVRGELAANYAGSRIVNVEVHATTLGFMWWID